MTTSTLQDRIAERLGGLTRLAGRAKERAARAYDTLRANGPKTPAASDASWWDPERARWNGLGTEQKQAQQLQHFRNHFRWLLKSLDAPPRKEWKVLEAGDGKYGWSHVYKQYFDQVWGADINDFSEYHPGVPRLVCDFTKEIPLPAASLDLVASHSVLEHVFDVDSTLANIFKVLRVGGYFFVSISPLYFSATGAHVNHPVHLANWEHLDPKSKYYDLSNPMRGAQTKGHDLNKMTWSDFLGWVGRYPWSIVQHQLLFDDKPLPAWVDVAAHRQNELRTKGFMLLLKKQRHW